jgi:ketosteroid isomerase-like protein
MAITTDYVRQILHGLESGDNAAVFQYVADDADWTVMDPQPWACPRFDRALSREEWQAPAHRLLLAWVLDEHHGAGDVPEPPGDFVVRQWWLRHADGRFP